MNQRPATQRTTEWANVRDAGAGLIDLAVVLQEHETVRTAVLHNSHEVGTWTLEYLGPGFHVQLRIARRNRRARLDGWITPARPVTVVLTSLLHRHSFLEAQVGDSGRFEFPDALTGACRMSFVAEGDTRHTATPPFWI